MAKHKDVTEENGSLILNHNGWKIYCMHPGYELWNNDNFIKEVDSLPNLFKLPK